MSTTPPPAPSVRAQAVTLRTYCRPLDEEGSAFEPWEKVIRRSTYEHHKRLWEEAGGKVDKAELRELEELGLQRKALVSGRTLWLGGTEYAYSRPACNFNCAWSPVQSVFDLVDVSWLLLNGAGVGNNPQAGILHGFIKPIPELIVVPSTRTKEEKGPKENEEIAPAEDNNYNWTIKVGDSAEAWAKSIGKMFTLKYPKIKSLTLDYSNVRGPGGRLKGYGWICNGWKPLGVAHQAYFDILNQKAGELLDEIDILDVVNHVGQILSSRRAAELVHIDSHHPRRKEFAGAKKDYWKTGKGHRRQSNNSLFFWSKPARQELVSLLHQAYENGDPGIVNAEAARRKAAYFQGVNPCTPAGTKVLTEEGWRPIETLVGNKINIWNGEEFTDVCPEITGINQPIVKVTLSDGRYLRCTPNHIWLITLPHRGEIRVPASDLREGMSVSAYPIPGAGTPTAQIMSVVPDGVAEKVYCFTEPKTNRGAFDGIVTGQCGETLLGRLCNLFSFSLRRLGRNFAAIERAIYIAARANYRQTCINLNDGILQPTWHQANEAQRLCGMTPTGICQADWLTDYQIRRLRNAAVTGAYSMADELGLPRPKAITLITPSGTRAKIDGDVNSETTEGIHKPLGRCIFNWVNFSTHDPLVGVLQAAGYRTMANPNDSNNVLVCFPVEYNGLEFDRVDDLEVNLETAITQLNRYLRWNNLWCDHNASCTVSFDREEIPEIVDWLDTHWDHGFIAVSFLRRNNPLLRPEDLGHPYLPQIVVGQEEFYSYKERLRTPDFSKVQGIFDIDVEDCPGGVCPVR